MFSSRKTKGPGERIAFPFLYDVRVFHMYQYFWFSGHLYIADLLQLTPSLCLKFHFSVRGLREGGRPCVGQYLKDGLFLFTFPYLICSSWMGYPCGSSFIKESGAKSRFGKEKKGKLNSTGTNAERSLPVLCLFLPIVCLFARHFMGGVRTEWMGQPRAAKLEFVLALSALRWSKQQ